MSSTIPVIVFAYARTWHLAQVLESLRENRPALLYAFSDGPVSRERSDAVAHVRDMLRGIDWCELVLVERHENLGLGRSIVEGVTSVLKQHNSAIIVEDDLVCVPGTYDFLTAALRHYQDDPRVMSVTAWNHLRVTPDDAVDQPYFDGRAECWVWGTWANAWAGMDRTTALELVRECETQGIDIYKYGADLVQMAKNEMKSNIWAVRWVYKHILAGAVSLRPPRSMVTHLGVDDTATNTTSDFWHDPTPRSAPPIPSVWPEPIEHPACPSLWRAVYGGGPGVPGPSPRLALRIRRRLRRMIARVGLGD